VQRVGVGQRTVDVEQQGPAHRFRFGFDHFRTFPNPRRIDARDVSIWRHPRNDACR
jgi:hypothetical protein